MVSRERVVMTEISNIFFPDWMEKNRRNSVEYIYNGITFVFPEEARVVNFNGAVEDFCLQKPSWSFVDSFTNDADITIKWVVFGKYENNVFRVGNKKPTHIACLAHSMMYRPFRAYCKVQYAKKEKTLQSWWITAVIRCSGALMENVRKITDSIDAAAAAVDASVAAKEKYLAAHALPTSMIGKYGVIVKPFAFSYADGSDKAKKYTAIAVKKTEEKALFAAYLKTVSKKSPTEQCTLSSS